MQLIKALTILATLPLLSLANPTPVPEDTPEPPFLGKCPTRPVNGAPPAPKRNPALKISIPINKLDKISSKDFDRLWTRCNIPLALDCPTFTENVIKFSAVHNTPELRAELASLGYPMLDYDGIIEFWVKDLASWQKVTASDCWQTVRKDAQTFTKWPYQFMYGYEEIALDQN